METLEQDIQLIANSHLEQNQINPVINNIGEMNAHFLACYPNEGCGVVVNNRFIACENVHETPEEDFRIRRGDYLKHELEGGIEAVVHSHTMPTPCHRFDQRTPSMADMTGQKATAVPWGIVATEGENVTIPLWYGLKEPAPIEGRFYVHNVYDCLTCVLDYLKINFDIDCETVPRPMEWEALSKNLIVENVETCGFEFLPSTTEIKDLKHGDAILFKVQANYVNHCGVITEDGMFMHQLMGRFTKKDHVAKWHKQIAMFVRHKDLT